MLALSISIAVLCGFWAVSCKLKPTVVNTSAHVNETHTMSVQSSVNTKDWKRIDLKAFSFSLPPGVKERKVRGTDSIVWKYAGDGMELIIDLGPYGGKPSVYETKPEYREDQIEISGQKAVMIFFRSDHPYLREQPYVAAVYFSEVGSKEAKLSLTVRATSRAGQDIANAIFRSIKLSGVRKGV